MGSSNRLLLNQSTHSSVAYSTASNGHHGPRRWMAGRPDAVIAGADGEFYLADEWEPLG